MLLNSRSKRSDKPVEFDAIHNYYEKLVFEHLCSRVENTDREYIADIACVALNHLPPRYIRHDVDMAFYLSPLERDEILNKVENAVSNAIELVNKRTGDDV